MVDLKWLRAARADWTVSTREVALIFGISAAQARAAFKKMKSVKVRYGRYYAEVGEVRAVFDAPPPAPEPSSIGGCGARNWFAD